MAKKFKSSGKRTNLKIISDMIRDLDKCNTKLIRLRKYKLPKSRKAKIPIIKNHILQARNRLIEIDMNLPLGYQ